MLISREEFKKKYKELYLAKTPYIATLAYWKMKYLIESFLIEQTIERCKDKSNDICVGGTVEFYRKCGFYDYELWVWAAKDGYQFSAPIIQP